MADLDKLAALAPFRVSDNSWDGYEIEGAYSIVEPDDIAAALNEWAELRALLELVAGNLLAAQQKRLDAPLSAESHADEALNAISRFATNGHYGDRASAMRLDLWTVNGEITRENAELRAYRERTEAALARFCAKVAEPSFDGYGLVVGQSFDGTRRVRDMARDDLQESGLWREPATEEASDGK